MHGINELFNSGIELEGAVLDKNNTLIAELSNLEIEKIKSLGFSYVVFIDDVSQFYLTRNEKYSNYNIIRDIKGNYPVPNDFEVCTMSGFCTFLEMQFIKTIS